MGLITSKEKKNSKIPLSIIIPIFWTAKLNVILSVE
jgi:hypothetical protein